MRRYIEDLDIDYSKYIRELITADRFKKQDPKILDSKIKECQEEINRLKDLKKRGINDSAEIHDLLAYHAPKYKLQAQNRIEIHRIRFIEKAILPDLKKLGFKGSPQEIDELLINWPEA